MNESQAMDPGFTVSEAARELGCSEGTIRRKADRGELQFVRVGGNRARLITRASLALAKRERDEDGATAGGGAER